VPLPGSQRNIFETDQKKQDFKSALKQENRVEKLQGAVQTAPKLELKVLSSAYLDKGEVLLINSLGLEGSKSKRMQKDGFTYFGCKKSIKKAIS